MRLLHQIPPNTYDDDLALTPRDGPLAVIGVMSELAEAAMAANVWLLHTNDVEFPGGKPRIALGPPSPDEALTTAPEVPRGGAVPSTLTWSVAAISSIATLGTLEPLPETPELHRVWVDGLRERLRTLWEGKPGTEPAIELVGRCLSYDPDARPHPKNLAEEVAKIRASVDGVATPEPVLPFLATEPPPVSRSVSGPAPATQPVSARSHPLVPYAAAAVVLAGLALVVALCTFAVVMGQFSDLAAQEAPAGTSEATSVPAPPRAAPPAPGVAPDSLFDRFDREPTLIPVPVAPGQVAPVQVAPGAPPPEPVRPAPSAPPPRPAPREERPKAAPGSDLRDPWNR